MKNNNNCLYCKKELINKYNLFCSSFCENQNYYKNTDIKNYSILNNRGNLNFYYLLGLIVTDGNIFGTRCRVGLQKQDSHILFDIKKKFGGQIFKDKKNTFYWYTHNINFMGYLKSLGLTTNKTYTLNDNKLKVWFCNLENNQKWAFILGVVDGDGNIRINKHTNSYFGYQLCIECANKGLLKFIKEFTNLGNIYERPIGTYKGQTVICYKYSISGVNCVNFLDNLYKEKVICIKRKKEVYYRIKILESKTVNKGLPRLHKYLGNN